MATAEDNKKTKKQHKENGAKKRKFLSKFLKANSQENIFKIY